MSLSTVKLAWHTCMAGQLFLRMDTNGAADPTRVRAVPAHVADALIEGGSTNVTDDPAADLIRAESRWRLRSAQLEDTAAQLYKVAVTAFADTHALPPTPREFADQLAELAVHRERRPRTLLRTAVDQFVASCQDLSAAQARVRAVRGFVTGLDLPGVDAPAGLLAGAQAGWRRDPAIPPYVSVYATEEVFVVAKPLRGHACPRPAQRERWMAPPAGLVAGETFGVGWRRDGDDDDPYTDEPAVLGPWRLGYIPATGEIYATRRCHYREPQVWLLARGHHHPGRTRQLLSTLKRRMGEPNSLLLAAHVVRDKPDIRTGVDARRGTSVDRRRGVGEATGRSTAPDGWGGTSEPEPR